MTAADDALRYARETYAEGTPAHVAAAAAALAQAEQLARIAHALEGILDAYMTANAARTPAPVRDEDRARAAAAHPLVGRRVRVARGGVLVGMRGTVVRVDRVAGVLSAWVEPAGSPGAVAYPVGDIDPEDVAP